MQNKILIYPDPNGKFEDVNSNRLLEACGLLPYFAMDENLSHYRLKEAMERAYGFGDLYEIVKGEIDSAGVYSYPGDEPLNPLMKIVRYSNDGHRDILYIYEYAIVAICEENEKPFISRMD